MDLAKLKAQKGQFFVKKIESELVLIVEGEIREDNSWRPTTFSVREKGQIFRYDEIEQIPAIHRSRFRSLVEKQGLEEQNLLTYLKEKGEIPSLDWALLAGFFSSVKASADKRIKLELTKINTIIISHYFYRLHQLLLIV